VKLSEKLFPTRPELLPLNREMESATDSRSRHWGKDIPARLCRSKDFEAWMLA